MRRWRVRAHRTADGETAAAAERRADRPRTLHAGAGGAAKLRRRSGKRKRLAVDAARRLRQADLYRATEGDRNIGDATRRASEARSRRASAKEVKSNLSGF